MKLSKIFYSMMRAVEMFHVKHFKLCILTCYSNFIGDRRIGEQTFESLRLRQKQSLCHLKLSALFPDHSGNFPDENFPQ